MERKDFNSYIDGLGKNDLRRACFVVREYMRCSQIDKNNPNCLVLDDDSAITMEEYLRSLKIILSYSYESSLYEDINVELSHCNPDCTKNVWNKFCNGEFSIEDTEDNRLCKYYRNPR